jgi:hypothetical protein
MGCLLVCTKLSKMRSIAALLFADPLLCKTAFDCLLSIAQVVGKPLLWQGD